ncbi:MAG TPA: biotin transporter BioY [Clostridiales bacterium]|nr:biotin transporter BioY [Clostridiales bacterium]
MENTKGKKKFTVLDLTKIALLTALMAVTAWITIPIPPISFTLQIFAIYAALFLLGGKYGTVSILLYLLIGAVGVPVFSGFRGGIGVLLGMTGGYLVGFVVSGLVYWAVTAHGREGLFFKVIGSALALVSCYAFGTAWYIILYTSEKGAITLGTALMGCVVPFILPDIVKIVLAYLVAAALKKRIR